MNKRLHLTITGKVQGVCFRAYVMEKASLLGLKGYVKNKFDGTVKIIAEGPERKLLSLIEFCKRGPLAAEVNDLKTTWPKFKKEFDKFNIKY